jgi:hypothetical protein
VKDERSVALFIDRLVSHNRLTPSLQVADFCITVDDFLQIPTRLTQSFFRSLSATDNHLHLSRFPSVLSGSDIRHTHRYVSLVSIATPKFLCLSKHAVVPSNHGLCHERIEPSSNQLLSLLKRTSNRALPRPTPLSHSCYSLSLRPFLRLLRPVRRVFCTSITDTLLDPVSLEGVLHLAVICLLRYCFETAHLLFVPYQKHHLSFAPFTSLISTVLLFCRRSNKGGRQQLSSQWS